MKIITARRISQMFFFTLLVWFCVVTALGERWWQLRGWPVNWLLQLDPLAGLGVLLATHTIYSGLIWGLVTIALTLLLGRVFCGWICPFGALQQFAGYLGKRGLNVSRRIARNRPHKGQRIKYWLLLFLLGAAAANLMHFLFAAPFETSVSFGMVAALAVLLVSLGVVFKALGAGRRAATLVVFFLIAGVTLEGLFPHADWLAASLQTGLLEPISLMQRSINLALLPAVDNPAGILSAGARHYRGAGLIGVLFLAVVLLSARVPRFYCRFLCPTGALLGLLSRWAVWNIARSEARCTDCRQCETDCEGACAPAETIRTHECVLCFNCRDQCRPGAMAYRWQGVSQERRAFPDVTRREVLAMTVGGLVAIPMIRLGGFTGAGWNAYLIRPPGALNETAFLTRCIKCGQCMRICPTNVIQPALWEAGLEGLWTPVLEFRQGTSGCQHNCVACSQVCPTAALRPLSVDERLGRNAYADAGPVRIGMAFVDRGRCLPWAMDSPCIVCQENCPVSPKAIFTRTLLQPLRDGRHRVLRADGVTIELDANDLMPGQWAGGDYFCRTDYMPPRLITENTGNTLVLGPEPPWAGPPVSGETVEVVIQLQQPYIDPKRCIGCGVCQHECPVQGLRAIRVTAENESRQASHRMTLLPGGSHER